MKRARKPYRHTNWPAYLVMAIIAGIAFAARAAGCTQGGPRTSEERAREIY